MKHVAVNIEKLTKRYVTNIGTSQSKQITVLRDINLTIKEGERWGIIGKNGSGKSTLLKVLSGLVKPSDGQVVIKGRVNHILNVGDNFLPDLTGAQNALFFFRLNGMGSKQAEKALKEAASFAEIGDFLYQPVKTYSDGMYLRLAFGACLQLASDILIVDEVFSVGDASFREKFQRELHRYISRTSNLIVVSHDPREIISYCTHCLWLDAGEQKMVGEAQEVESAYYQEIARLEWSRDYERSLDEQSLIGNNFIKVENNLLSLNSVTIGPPSGFKEMTYESGVVFSIEIEKKKEQVFFHPGVHIYDYLMNNIMFIQPVADSEADQQIRSLENVVGKIKMEIVLPPKILSFGTYYMEVMFSKNTSSAAQYIELALKMPAKMVFKVSKGQIHDFSGSTFNVFIKPECKFHFEY
ncbi:MAG: ATP-binding cassette domain-containing protein [Chitinophagales bacterium]|nr:ATP-binding cassette domain-containing protein [Chitinophagales bacterium]